MNTIEIERVVEDAFKVVTLSKLDRREMMNAMTKLRERILATQSATVL